MNLENDQKFSNKKVRGKVDEWPCSKNFIFLVNYEWAQKARVFVL